MAAGSLTALSRYVNANSRYKNYYTDNYVDIKIEITKDIPVQKVLKSMYLNIV